MSDVRLFSRYRIDPAPQPLGEALVRRLATIDTSTLGHAVPWYLMSQRLKALQRGRRVVGTAVTLSIPGADSTLLHHALGQLRPGDLLVVDRLGDTRPSCWPRAKPRRSPSLPACTSCWSS